MAEGVVRKLFTVFGFDVKEGKLVRMNKLTDQAKVRLDRASASAKNFGNSVRNAALAFTGFVAARAGFSAILEANVTLQSLKASLFSIEGSAEAANAAFDKISEFATRTPFELVEVAQSFIKLKNLGLEPSEAALESYGNTASAMGKSLDQLIEAVADAATGEFERLKEFGIKTKKEGENVVFTFRGVKTTVRNESGEIQKFIRGIGDVQFGGAMARQMDTLGGRISNLKDAFFRFLTAIGEAGLNDALNSIAVLMLSAAEGSGALAEQIGQALVKAIEIGKDVFGKLGEALAFAREHSDELKVAIIALLSVMVIQKVFGFAASIGATLVSAFSKAAATAALAGTSLKTFAGALAVVKGALLSFVGGAGALKFALIGGAVILVTLALIDLFRFFNSGEGVIAGFVDKFSDAGGVLGAIADGVRGALEVFQPAFDSIVEGFSIFFEAAKSTIGSVISLFLSLASFILTPFIKIISFIVKIIAVIVALFARGFAFIFSKTASIFAAIASGLKLTVDIIESLLTAVTDAVGLALDFWGEAFGFLFDNWVKPALKKIRDAFEATVEFLKFVFEPVVDGIKAAFRAAENVVRKSIRALPKFILGRLPEDVQKFARGLTIAGREAAPSAEDLKEQRRSEGLTEGFSRERLEQSGFIEDGKFTVSAGALAQRFGQERAQQIIMNLGEINVIVPGTSASPEEIANATRKGVAAGTIDLSEAARDAGATP